MKNVAARLGKLKINRIAYFIKVSIGFPSV